MAPTAASKTGSSLVKLRKILRNAVAGTLIACVPVSATVAATRPNAAVPMASAQAVTAQDEGAAGVPWVPLVAIGIAAVVAIIIIASKNGNGNGALSRG